MPKLRPFATYDAEGDLFTLHFYLGKEIGGNVVPCLRCGQTMSGLVGPLGICTGGTHMGGGTCNTAIFPYLYIAGGKDYHDHKATVEQLLETRTIAIKHLTEIEPGVDDWNVDGLNEVIRLIDEAIVDRSVAREVTRIDTAVCAQCGFKEPCSCAALSQQEVN